MTVCVSVDYFKGSIVDVDRLMNIGMKVMLHLHYVPGGHGSPVCPKRSAP